MRQSQEDWALRLRERQLEDLKNLPSDLRSQLMATFDEEAARLRRLQDEAAELLLSSQRQAAGLLLEATQRVRDGWDSSP